MIFHVDASRPTPARTSGLFAFCAEKHTNPPNQEFTLYLPIKKIAAHYNRHPDTIRNWIASGKFPKPILLPSGRPAWDDSVLRHDVASAVADTPR
jgi:predicted DNA-binding transcriptional regulator AlpA